MPDWVKRLLLAAGDPERMSENLATVRAKFAKKLQHTARRIPFSRDLLAAYYCALDPKSPPAVRATLLGALAYFILPMDSIPDFLLGFGYTDDATVLMAAISMVSGNITERHRAAADAVIDGDADLDEIDDPDIEAGLSSDGESAPGIDQTTPVIDVDYTETTRSIS